MTNSATKSAIITGASGGIGGSIAKRLAKDVFSVVVNYAGKPAQAQAVAADLKAAGGQGIAVQALWIDCNEKEFGDAASAVMLIQHILVHCESKIAELPEGIAFEDVFREATEAEAQLLEQLDGCFERTADPDQMTC
jgi:NAD(P)-dependent dehydrogenase (short-subunit alcohol dehydrogenase family)